jgi:glutaredoxin 3
MKALIWSKSDCPYCINAKLLLESKGIEYEEKIIGQGYTKQDLLDAIPSAKTVPQIFLGDEYVGGYKELKQKLLPAVA